MELRCLVEGREEVLEALNFEARPTVLVIKAAMNGEFVKATTSEGKPEPCPGNPETWHPGNPSGNLFTETRS